MSTQPSVQPDDHPELPCGIGDWDHVVYGHHRFLVEVSDDHSAARMVLPWRRHDSDPGKVDTWVLSPKGRRVRNVLRRHIDHDSGEFVFEPVDGPGTYAAYYLPYAHTGSAYYPQALYRTVTHTADPDWARQVVDSSRQADLPEALVVRYEASSRIDSFAGLGFAATDAERARLSRSEPDAAFRLFAEDRDHGIGRADYLPARWARVTPEAAADFSADRGEFYPMQVGVYAFVDLDQVELTIDGLPFPVLHLTGGGTSEHGEPISRRISVPEHHLQSLWLGFDIPADCRPGEYRGTITVRAAGQRRSVEVSVAISDRVVNDRGVSEPERLARLGWLDDTTGQGHELVSPYTPVRMEGTTLSILGRQVELGDLGLPSRLVSTFTPAVTSSDGPPIELLSEPITLDLGRPMEIGPIKITPGGPDEVRWQSSASADGVQVEVDGRLEFDGCLSYRIRLTTDTPSEVPDLRLSMPISRQVADYWMGLGRQGGLCPDDLDWSWDVGTAHQEGGWIGTASAGLQFALRDDHYRRPLNTNYYRERPLREPRWANGGAGGIRLRSDDSRRRLEAYTGSWQMSAGQTVVFDVRFLLTPFKPIEAGKHLLDRYVHEYASPEAIAEQGGTVVNLHHATPPNPYINDPMRAEHRLAEYTEEAHRHGLRVKIYDTVRELTRYVPELPALLALGDEVFAAGPGGGHAWLQEHLPPDYVPGWAATTVDDVAIVTAGESRWHNIYVRSVEHLAARGAIDGLYLDDVSYDRTTMKRIRKVLARHRPDPLIDLHSASQFNERDGYTSSANLYLDLMPYLDRLWFGEYVDYEGTDPAYWLVEVSGVAFGLMGEMLENGGNPWRGMVFGMTGRAPRVDNRSLWSAWDSLGLPRRSMIGWWAGEQALRTDDPRVLATVFAGGEDAVIAVASWNDQPTKITFESDRLAELLTVDSISELELSAPKIDNFQDQARFDADEAITISPGRGWLLHARRRVD